MAKNETLIRLGKRIRAVRVARGLSQDQLAEKAGLSGKYLGEVERGEGNISIDLLSRVADSLLISLRDLMDAGHERPYEEVRAEIIRLTPSLSEKEAKIVYRMIKIFINS